MSKDNESRFFIPLTNLESELRRVELAPGYVIRKITEGEQQDMIKRYDNVWPKFAYGELAMECAVAEQILKGDPRLWAAPVERGVLALRLYKEGTVGYNVIVLIPSVKTGHSLALHRRPWSGADVRESSDKYVISTDEVKELQDFFAEFVHVQLGDLDLAAEYFSKSYEEAYAPRDSFVDLIIALESLYLKGERYDLGRKLRTRMAKVLGVNSSDREDILDTVEKAYALRGDIVHGEKRPTIDVAFLLKVRGYARESAKIFIRDPDRRDNL